MNRYSRLIMVLIVLSTLCLEGIIVSPIFAASGKKMAKDLDPAIENKGQQIRGDDESRLRFMGMAEPWESYSVVLLPGETVEKVHVKRGDQVEKGSVLLRIVNDQLSNSIGDLIRKQNEIGYNVQQTSLLSLEIEIKEKYLVQIDGKLKKEEELVKNIPGYSSQLSKQLDQQKKQLSDQLVMSRAKDKMARQMNEKNKKLSLSLQVQIDKLLERQKQLEIKAPFAGKIFYIVDDPFRAVPGRPVCELWNEKVLMVRGKIMQHQYSHVRLGEKVKVSMEFSKQSKLDGIVHSIEQGMAHERDPRAMQGYAAFSVLIRVDEPHWLKPGMMVSVEMLSALRKN